MASESESSNTRGRSRKRRSRGGRGRSKKKIDKPIYPDHYRFPALPTSDSDEPCPLCGGPLKELHEAITDAESGKPAHFDCVYGRIASGQELSEGEQLCYLGSGVFGVVGYTRREGKKVLEVRKRIEYEQKDSALEWRREFSPGLAKEWPDDQYAARIEDYEAELRKGGFDTTNGNEFAEGSGDIEEMQNRKLLEDGERE
ncbi:MAG: hypothetical protein LC641_05890 [Spirochaeta sp.]|nr:hypothetical protein [Spirochaeta sp.]